MASSTALLLLAFVPASVRLLQIHVWPKPVHVPWPFPAAVFLSPSFRILMSYPFHRPLRRAIARYRHLIFTEHHRPLIPRPSLSPTSPAPSTAASTSPTASPSHPGSVPSHRSRRRSPGAPSGGWRPPRWRGGDQSAILVGDHHLRRPHLTPPRAAPGHVKELYYPVPDILQTTGAKAANKLNVFHLHITDSHFFPVLLVLEARRFCCRGPGRLLYQMPRYRRGGEMPRVKKSNANVPPPETSVSFMGRLSPVRNMSSVTQNRGRKHDSMSNNVLRASTPIWKEIAKIGIYVHHRRLDMLEAARSTVML